jgi:hypothetical protein
LHFKGSSQIKGDVHMGDQKSSGCIETLNGTQVYFRN